MGNELIFDIMEQYFPLKERIGNNDHVAQMEREPNVNNDLNKKTLKIDFKELTIERNRLGTECESAKYVPKNEQQSTVTWADIVRLDNKNN